MPVSRATDPGKDCHRRTESRGQGRVRAPARCGHATQQSVRDCVMRSVGSTAPVRDGNLAAHPKEGERAGKHRQLGNSQELSTLLGNPALTGGRITALRTCAVTADIAVQGSDICQDGHLPGCPNQRGHLRRTARTAADPMTDSLNVEATSPVNTRDEALRRRRSNLHVAPRSIVLLRQGGASTPLA